MPILQVALDVPLATRFDYRADDATPADIGRLVVVPFGPRPRVGVVLGVVETTSVDPARLRSALRIARGVPALPDDVIALALFCADYWRATPGEVLLAALPTALRRPDAPAHRAEIAWRLTAAGSAVTGQGWPKSATVRRRLLDALQGFAVLTATDVAALGTSARRSLAQFEASGWVERTDALAPLADASTRAPVPLLPDPASAGRVLTDDQRSAVATVRAAFGGFAAVLLQGVTGSGKTEVYLQLAADAAARGGQTLLLVPEIHLTPQLEGALEARFGAGTVVSLHSGLADGERLARWRRAQSGEARVVVGTRLAVFTPLPRLALVVVDEEHDPSYKQHEGVRYHARDLAIWRARHRGIPVVLGSATPSIETWRHARDGRYARVVLAQRANRRPPPTLRLIDLRTAPAPDGLSAPLVDAIADRIARGEQSLVFVNRRGYAPTLLCHACGWVAPCPSCSARLVLHQRAGELRCHWCGHVEAVVDACPACGNQDLRPVGEGTQRLEDALAARQPQARVVRVDRDAMRRRDAFTKVRAGLADRSIDVLVGTQMLAKGHDFPRLTLVGIVGTDAGLYSVDFRAEERLYAMVTQVAGRAGRADRPGEVLLQTAFPDHPLHAALQAQDFDAFAATQLALRETYGFPPVVHHVLLRADGPDEAEVFTYLALCADAARALAVDGVTVHDPVAASLARVAGRWRAHVLVASTSRPALRHLLQQWVRLPPPRQVRAAIDVDPLES
ncbi:MAG: primosomal protein N' [Burkholderiales bacterium]|jgi:primosomal protein N' (replication factor Y)|nr:primosomal protein N' [Burkholderiales bacterium]